MLKEIGIKAKQASRRLATADTDAKNHALLKVAMALETNAAVILRQNAVDVANASSIGKNAAFIDRLQLDESRIAAMADGLREVAALPDPVGRILSTTTRPNGLFLKKVTVPIGVLAVIFESRPNVTADAAGLCLKSGNAVILKGGKEAINSNQAITQVMREALADTRIPIDSIQLITDNSRENTLALMHLNTYVDALIPRGGSGLIRAVVENASVPVIETGAGTCHVYVDKDADIAMAAEIIFNAKTSRPSVCNACECMLIHQDIAAQALPVIAAKLRTKHTIIRGDETTRKILPDCTPATTADWGCEYLDYIIASKVVRDINEAIDHITTYGTGHSECIVTADSAAADAFMRQVDAAAVYHNASTRFTDGHEFGLGAEIGISTQKLHARGPLGLAELTSYKYLIYGNGQVRE